MNDHRYIALVIDMRSKNAFEKCALEKSINFPVERFNEETFLNWAKEAAILEKDSSILDEHQSHLLKHRKRLWLYIIAS